mgnify:CR=1 FL=1
MNQDMAAVPLRMALVLLTGCTHVATASSAAAFKTVNVPVMNDGVPGESRLTSAERARWCQRLTDEALTRIPLAGDEARRIDDCAVQLQPAPGRQLVPGVRVVFSVDAFARRPFAAASYDEATRTLYLPLGALDAPWSDVQATRHEWRHARIDASADDAALRSRAVGPRFKPDSFVFDELLVNTCDLVDAEAAGVAPPPWQRPMVESMLAQAVEILGEARRAPIAAHLSLGGGTTLELRGAPADSLARLTQLEHEVREGLAHLQSLRPRCEALLGARP